ncbi:MAG: hypothetical protein ACKN9W_17870 [Methylococcus sp.]
MKKHGWIAMMMALSITGCQSDGLDHPSSLAHQGDVITREVLVNGYPVAVTVKKLDADTYEVESREARFITFSGVRSPDLLEDRFRRGGQQVMSQIAGRDGKASVISETSSARDSSLAMVYKIDNGRPSPE